MRAITAEAGVNLASVNYYFRSKDNLIAEVLCRAIRPLNKQRLALLQQEIDVYQPAPVLLPKILNALFRLCLEISFDSSRQNVFQLLGRSLSE
jgi:AcrR family transcriptional regulator